MGYGLAPWEGRDGDDWQKFWKSEDELKRKTGQKRCAAKGAARHL